EELCRTLSKDREVILQEPLPNLDDAWLSGPRGTHVVELVVPLRLRNISALDDPFRDSVQGLKCRSILLKEPTRVKPPGSDWIFLKLYGPRTGEDSLIAGPIRQFCSSLPRMATWYFLRYADPRPQLRVRFHSDVGSCGSDMIAAVSRWATELMEQ